MHVTTTEMNFRDVATVHSVAGVFFTRCGKSCDLPQRTLLINCDGHFLPAAVNGFTAVDILTCPSRKIYIFRDGRIKMSAAVNGFTAADILICPSRKIYIFRGGRIKMPATVNQFTAAGNLLCPP